MEIYGINNITDSNLNFDYDKHYKQVALKLKAVEIEQERNKIRKVAQENLSNSINIQIDIKKLKNNFLNIILDENSSKYLWILYSKYKDGENYIDKISGILKKENSIIRGGTNTYKMNGWMAHTLYVYQIINYNIANNKEILNFGDSEESKKQVMELNILYNQLDEQSKFILKIFALIHDIGVIEDVKYHPEVGTKYVEKVIKEIGLDEQQLEVNNIKISFQDLIQILKVIIKYHILITTLSAEASDQYVELCYRDLISNIPDINYIKNNISKILFIFSYADIIGVDETLMNREKYNRLKEGYYFFESISQNKKLDRDKENVSIERICDTVGINTSQQLKRTMDEIFKKYKIDKDIFMQNMYDIKNMRYTGTLMKTVNNLQLTIRIYYEIFELINKLEGRQALKEYTIIFVPDKHEQNFVEQFKNGNFFECVELMKKNKSNSTVYGNIKISIQKDYDSKYLHISVI